MQGKFQLLVLPEAGHFVHEDCAEKVAGTVVEFWRRNERGGLVLPMKVEEMLRLGRKV
jgi:protein phosphatase methylesterase 1